MFRIQIFRWESITFEHGKIQKNAWYSDIILALLFCAFQYGKPCKSSPLFLLLLNSSAYVLIVPSLLEFTVKMVSNQRSTKEVHIFQISEIENGVKGEVET